MEFIIDLTEHNKNLKNLGLDPYPFPRIYISADTQKELDAKCKKYETEINAWSTGQVLKNLKDT